VLSLVLADEGAKGNMAAATAALEAERLSMQGTRKVLCILGSNALFVFICGAARPLQCKIWKR
jgi:hypothetical protein